MKCAYTLWLSVQEIKHNGDVKSWHRKKITEKLNGSIGIQFYIQLQNETSQ